MGKAVDRNLITDDNRPWIRVLQSNCFGGANNCSCTLVDLGEEDSHSEANESTCRSRDPTFRSIAGELLEVIFVRIPHDPVSRTSQTQRNG